MCASNAQHNRALILQSKADTVLLTPKVFWRQEMGNIFYRWAMTSLFLLVFWFSTRSLHQLLSQMVTDQLSKVLLITGNSIIFCNMETDSLVWDQSSQRYELEFQFLVMLNSSWAQSGFKAFENICMWLKIRVWDSMTWCRLGILTQRLKCHNAASYDAIT